jgi:hypothetical protein
MLCFFKKKKTISRQIVDIIIIIKFEENNRFWGQRNSDQGGKIYTP